MSITVSVKRGYKGGILDSEKNVSYSNSISKTYIEKSGELGGPVRYYLHGFEGDDCELTWDDSDFTLYVDGVDFGLWNRGTLSVMNTDSVQIDSSSVGLWYIFYNGEKVLTASQEPWELEYDNPVALIDWDGDTGIMTDNRYWAFNLSHILISRISDAEQHWGRQIALDESKFIKNLDEEDTDVQKAMETLDKLDLLAIGDWIDEIVWEYRDIEAGVSQTYVLDPKALFAYTINSVGLEVDTGTLTGVAIKIGSTAVTSLSSLTVDTAIDTTDATGANSVAIGDRVTLVTSTGYTGMPQTLIGNLSITRL